MPNVGEFEFKYSPVITLSLLTKLIQQKHPNL